MFKKAEGTASSYLIASLIGVTMLVAIGIFVNSMSNSYSQTTIVYFANYEPLQEDAKVLSDEMVTNQDVNGTEGWLDALNMEDLMFVKAFKTVNEIRKASNTATDGVEKLSKDLQIPPIFSGLIITVLGVTLIVLILGIIRGYQRV